MAQVQEAKLSLVKAAALLEVSYRQAKRIWSRYRRQGDEGLVHRSRGRPSGRRIDPKTRAAIVERKGVRDD